MLIPKTKRNGVELLELHDEYKEGRIIARAEADSYENKKPVQKRSGKDPKSNFSTPFITRRNTYHW